MHERDTINIVGEMVRDAHRQLERIESAHLDGRQVAALAQVKAGLREANHIAEAVPRLTGEALAQAMHDLARVIDDVVRAFDRTGA